MRLSVQSADLTALTSRTAPANKAALGVVAENVLADCTPYVPYKTGALRGSGKATALADSATVAWGTDSETARYARAQYYGSYDHGTDANAINAPKACARWFEAAQASRKAAWVQAYSTEYTRRLHNG
jgi:hypothetical protein